MNKRKNKNKNKKNFTPLKTTFDPKIHHRSSKGSGYGLKRDIVQDPSSASGSQLISVFKDWAVKK